MKKLLLFSVLLLTGCGAWNKIHPNLATRLVKTHPRLQDICDSVGGCQNVVITCTRYDGYGNTNLRNKTFWDLSTDVPAEAYNNVSGYSLQDNDHLNTYQAIEDAISSYWSQEENESQYHQEPRNVFPHSAHCEKDCGQ